MEHGWSHRRSELTPMMAMTREVRLLAMVHNPDGRRGMLASKDPTRDLALSARMIELFHSGSAQEHRCSGGRKLEPLCSEPNVYLVRHFLSARELDHLDELLTSRRRSFRLSHTDDESGGTVLSTERTSVSLALPKAADATLRAIETRAAELVGLPPDFVEPLQIVHYTNGAKFNCHHDLGPVSVEVDDECRIRSAAGAHSSSGQNSMSRGSMRRQTEKETVVVDHTGGARRLVTLFLYLNTLPEGVGHTHFPYINLSVRPRSGAALLFCNVTKNGAPDPRLCHEACPVPSGSIKFGCNVWITDATMQAHAVEAVPKSKGSGAAKSGGGILAPLLQTDHADTPPPQPAALIGIRVSQDFGSHGVFEGEVKPPSPPRACNLIPAHACPGRLLLAYTPHPGATGAELRRLLRISSRVRRWRRGGHFDGRSVAVASRCSGCNGWTSRDQTLSRTRTIQR